MATLAAERPRHVRRRQSRSPSTTSSTAGGSGARAFEDHSPIDWSLIADVARGDAETAEPAVGAALAAAPAWAALGPAGRRRLPAPLADLSTRTSTRLAAVECPDMAMPSASLRRALSPAARATSAPTPTSRGLPRARLVVERHAQPRPAHAPGPAVVITPWNAPFMLSTWKFAPALAAGCTVVLKPAEWSPLSCSLLADLATRPASRPGVFNVVQGIGEEVGAALVADPRVRRVSFTGSPERRATSASPPRATWCRSRASSAARGRCSSSPTRTSTPQRARPPASSTTPARSASRARGCSWRRPCATRSSSASTPSRTPTCRRPAAAGDDARPAHPRRAPCPRRGVRRARAAAGDRSCAAAAPPTLGGLLPRPDADPPLHRTAPDRVRTRSSGRCCASRRSRTRTRRWRSRTRPASGLSRDLHPLRGARRAPRSRASAPAPSG